jgi:hypothetical protein
MTEPAVVVPVVVAVVSAIVGPILVLWRQHRHEIKLRQLQEMNTSQHAEGRSILSELRDDVKAVHRDLGKLDAGQESVVVAVGDIRQWITTHEVRHAVDAIRDNGD